MELTLSELYCVKFRMNLIAMVYLDNYYSQFYNPSSKQAQKRFLPLLMQFLVIKICYTKQNSVCRMNMNYLEGMPTATLKGARFVGLLPKR
jgi:hypothetical protein